MHRALARGTLLLVGGLLALQAFASALAYHEGPFQNHTFANIYFERTWEHVDKPVKNGRVERSWVWGPDAYSRGMREDYAESPDGEREVQYFDKSRMEITHPDGDDTSIWYVTNGLLVNELVSGRMQMGDNTFEQHEPAEVNVAGDPDDPDAVTYADLAALLARPATSTGTVLTNRLDTNGEIVSDPALAAHNVTAAERVTVPGIDHTIASPFWSFMNSSGVVYTPGMYYEDKLFENPYYATGYPITEAYWVTVDVGGVERTVLLQCFERRCLTFTPSNPANWQVEFGNVGQHYYRWRHGEPVPHERINLYMVATAEPATANALAFGCGDELVPVQRDIPLADTLPGRITNALELLLSLDDQFYGESGLLNALWMNDATVESVSVDAGVATVRLTGTIPVAGICDEPRVVEQLRATVAQFDGVDDVTLLLNGEPLFAQGAPQQP